MKFPYRDEQYWQGQDPELPKQHPGGSTDDRIIAAWGFARATLGGMSKAYQDDWRGAILDLGVRKGSLQVKWRDHQSRVMFEGVIVGAYEKATNECWHSHYEASDDFD